MGAPTEIVEAEDAWRAGQRQTEGGRRRAPGAGLVNFQVGVCAPLGQAVELPQDRFRQPVRQGRKNQCINQLARPRRTTTRGLPISATTDNILVDLRHRRNLDRALFPFFVSLLLRDFQLEFLDFERRFPDSQRVNNEGDHSPDDASYRHDSGPELAPRDGFHGLFRSVLQKPGDTSRDTN
ncbi:hypothetical protein BN2475_10010 [Paraburkholderia ribeironis]|uniref:Uncharacterized protein n=1 Tax=Paraburkholderia ribeironis TaxID=1247936 RepID=A0A1N7RII3_9BURK|nr:hypothetical protein BN2475_10010 [Paraburkholderia ribeironis]